MNAKKEIILITGASGRIGFKCAEYFSRKYQVVGFDVFLVGDLPGVEFVAVDLASEESIKEGLAYVEKKYGNHIVSVIHLAAYYSFQSSHSSNYDKITVKGTEKLLKNLQKFTVEQFIFSSTMLVHKPTEPGVKINEESPLSPTWGYPLSKVQTEKLIHEKRGDMPVVILRIAGVYDDQCHSIPLSNQLQRIHEKRVESHFFPGDISHGAAFIHMNDLVDSIALCVEKRAALPQELTLLIGEETTLSYDALQRMMQRLLFGREWKTYEIPKLIAKIGAWAQEHIPGMRPGFIKPWMIDYAEDHYELDISRAKNILGWRPKNSLERVIPKWIDALQRAPLAWYDENKLKMSRKIKKNAANA